MTPTSLQAGAGGKLSNGEPGGRETAMPHQEALAQGFAMLLSQLQSADADTVFPGPGLVPVADAASERGSFAEPGTGDEVVDFLALHPDLQQRLDNASIYDVSPKAAATARESLTQALEQLQERTGLRPLPSLPAGELAAASQAADRNAADNPLDWVQQLLQQNLAVRQPLAAGDVTRTLSDPAAFGFASVVGSGADSGVGAGAELNPLVTGSSGVASNQAAGSAAARTQAPLQMNQPNFASELGNRIVWMQRDGLERARVDVAPRELGPIELEMNIRDGRAELNLSALRAETRDALQQALPRLQEMLAAQGIQLDQANVSDGGRDEARPSGAMSADGVSTDDAEEAEVTTLAPVSQHDGLIDRYA